MSELVSWQLQKAISARLIDENIAEGRIYDMPPPSSKFPYIVLGEDEMKSWNSHTTKGYELRILLHVFSREEGRARIKKMAQEIADALDRQKLLIQGFKLLHVGIESIQTSRDPHHKTAQALFKIALLGIKTGADQ